MKKLFYYMAVVAATLTFAACGSKGPKVDMGNAPEEVKEFVNNINASIQKNHSEGVTYEGIEVKDHDILCTFTIDENQAEGLSMTEALYAQGMSPNDIQRYIKDGMLTLVRMHPASDNETRILREYQYNLVIRYKGSKSGEKIDTEIKYYEW